MSTWILLDSLGFYEVFLDILQLTPIHLRGFSLVLLGFSLVFLGLLHFSNLQTAFPINNLQLRKGGC
jgi:hypothetical protein